MAQEFNSGLAVLQQAIAEGQRKSEAARATLGGGKGLQYFNWKPNDKKIIRFIADDPVTEYFYDFILDKTGNTKNFMVPKDDPGRLLRYVSPAPGVGWRRNFKTGALEQPLLPNAKDDKGKTPPGAPRQMSACVAVLRTEVMREGKLVIEDYLYDKDVDGTPYPARFFGIVQQSISNFWRTLAVSCLARYGTLCDRDYEITRTGEGFDTAYSIIPLPPVEELTDLEKVKGFYFYGQPWDANHPQRFLRCPMTTLEWAEYFSGEERYAHWLTPEGANTPTPNGGYTPSGNDEFHKDTTMNDEAQASAPAPAGNLPPPSSTAFASLQEQLIDAAKNK